MSRPSPAAALNGEQTGHICDRCNRGIRTGDRAVVYATYYDGDGWIVRHGVATMWANHVGPHHAKEQLRHKSLNTTMKYLHSDAETRNSAVEQIW